MLADELLTGAKTILEPRASNGEEENVTVRTSPGAPSIALLGVNFDNVTLAQAAQRIEEMLTSRRSHYVVTANVDFLVQARSDVELRRILLDAHLVLCDGTPLAWASGWLGNRLPERVAGSDLVPQLVELAAEKRWRIFFLGGASDVTEQAVARLQAMYPDLTISGRYSPPFRPLLDLDHENIARRIRAARPDLLFVSFGCPKAEKWIAMHYRSLGVPVTIGVGATIDFLAGRVKRAPHWMQRIGIEWLFRLCQEPRRLYRRYAKDLRVFGWALAAQWWRTRVFLKGRHVKSRCLLTSTEQGWHLLRAPERLDVEAVRRDAGLWGRVVNRHCLLDLAGTRLIDSTGVGLLLQLRRQLRGEGRCLVLIAPRPAVLQILTKMRLEDHLLIAPDMVEARRLIKSQFDEPLPVIANGAARPLIWRGEITAANAEKVFKLTEAQLLPLIWSQRRLTIDIAEVRLIDTAALSMMRRVKQHAQRQGAAIDFGRAGPTVRNVIRLAQLETYLLGEAR